MPTFPDERQLLSTDVPGVNINPGAAGAVGEAIGNVGQQMLATTLPLIAQMKEAEAKDAAFREKADDMLESEGFIAELKLRNPTGYITDDRGEFVTNEDGTRRTISQEYHAWANDRFLKKQEKMPSELARQLYYQDAGAYYANSRNALRVQEDELKAKYFDSGQVSNLQKFSDNLVSTPEINKAYEFSNTIMGSELAQVGSTRSSVIASENVRKYNQQIAESLMDGAYNQVLVGIKSGDKSFNRSDAVAYWRGVLKGEDQSSLQRKAHGLQPISEMLDPDRKAAIEEKFIRLADLAKDLDLSDLRRQKEEIKAAFESGRASRVNLDDYRRNVQKHVAEKRITEFEAGSDFISDVIESKEIGRLKNDKFPLLTPAERVAEAKKAGGRVYQSAQAALGASPNSKIAGSINQASIEAKMGSYAERLLSQERSDFAGYLMEYDPVSRTAAAQLDFSRPEQFGAKARHVQQLLQQIDVYYARHFGGDERFKRIISKAGSKSLATALTNPNLSVEQSAEGVKSLRIAYGERYAELMDQIIRDGHLDEGWRSAASGESTQAIQDAVGALKGKKDFDKNFEVVAKAKGITDQNFDAIIGRKLGPYIQAMSQRSPNDPRSASVVAQKTTEIRNKAKQLIMDSPNLSENEAVERAANSLVFDRYHFAEVGGGWFTGTQKNLLMLPKRAGNLQINEMERDRIIEYAETHLKPEGLKSLGVLPPPGADGKPGQFDEKFYEQAAATGRFTVSRDELGLNFWWVNRQTGRHQQGFIKNSKGQLVPLYIPFSKAILPVPQPRDPKMESVKPPVFPGKGR